MIVLIDAEKAFNEHLIPTHDTNFSELVIEGNPFV